VVTESSQMERIRMNYFPPKRLFKNISGHEDVECSFEFKFISSFVTFYAQLRRKDLKKVLEDFSSSLFSGSVFKHNTQNISAHFETSD